MGNVFCPIILDRKNPLNYLTQSFVDKTGLHNQIQIDAVDSLVKGLLDNSILKDLVAVYPFVGKSLESYSYNLLNTALYKIEFGSTTEYTNHGVVFRTTESKTNIPFALASNEGNQNFTLSYYNTKINPNIGIMVDIYSTFAGANFTIYNYNSQKKLRVDFANNTTACLVADVTDTDGLKTVNVQNGTMTLYKNRNIVQTKVIPSGTIRGNILLNITDPTLDSTNEFSFLCVGKGLTQDKITILNNLISEFISVLGK